MKKNKSRNLSQFPKDSIYVSPLDQDETPSRKLSRSAKDNIVELVALTNKGAEDGPAELHSTVALATEMLIWLCQRSPERFTAIARNKFSWPLMCSLRQEHIRENAKFLNKLALGADTQINVSGKTFSWKVPANIVALKLHRLALSLKRVPIKLWTRRDLSALGRCGVGCSSRDGHTYIHRYNKKYEKQLKALEAWEQRGAGRDLPPLNKETAPQWATATKELFKIAYPGNFEEHPDLQELRASVLLRAHGRPGLVRKLMLQAVKQAWRSIAAWTK